MTALLDVSVLVALGWPNHVHHGRARSWFRNHSSRGWATTPVTQLGFVRISSNRKVLQVSTTPAIAIAALTARTALNGHESWPDDLHLVVGAGGDAGTVRTHRDVTDGHLIALAGRYGGRLATFDTGLGESAPDGIVEVL